ncbi:hypothetical protein HID58_046323, partial [Brassica napus]
LINDLVRQEDAKYILNIRPPISRRPDVLVWKYTRTWEYSVKTGYYIQRNFSTMETGNQETNVVISEEVRKCCSSIWSLNIPPKRRTFWWRMGGGGGGGGGIAVLDNLRRRGVKMETHVRVAREVWEISPTSFTVLDQSSNGVIQNINDQWNFKRSRSVEGGKQKYRDEEQTCKIKV